jgi:CBS domain-containing protein
MTTVADVMTRDVRSMTPNDTLIQAARAMKDFNIGAIPVCDKDRLVGMVTDRDLVVRGVAEDLDLKSAKLADIMSAHVHTVRESDDVSEVQSEMTRAKIRRMPVVDPQDHLVGIVSMGDAAAHHLPGHEVIAAPEPAVLAQAGVQPVAAGSKPQRQTS